MEERDRVVNIALYDKTNNTQSNMDFIISGADLETKSTRELKEIFVKQAQETFDKLISKKNVSKFLGGQ